MAKISRRNLLGAAGVVSAAAALGAGGYLIKDGAGGEAKAAGGALPFYGVHQGGISTPAQDRLLFAAFDLNAGSGRGDLVSLMQQWTDAAARMARGEPVGDDNDNLHAPPDDTGEATGLAAARLTITFGFGPSLFDGRFGLSSQRPAALIDLPAFPLDDLDPARSGGDIGIQVCADDPQVAFHAVRNLARIGRGVATMRWSQLGFGRTSSTSDKQETLRNLQGFKDGTNNLKVEDSSVLANAVWVGGDDQPAWMHDGSYVVTRRIRMFIEVWDRTSLNEQEQTIGRHKASGAPIGGSKEFDHVDLDARDAAGLPVVPLLSHIRLASPLTNDGGKLLRRGYSFTDGTDSVTGQLDSGLFFIAYQRDPRKQFVPIQTRLAATDALNEYIKHVASAIFACPPGATAGSFIGATLLA